MDNEYELLKCLDNITEELKRIADFLVASKVVPEKRESTIKKKTVKKVSPGFEGGATVVESITAPIFRVTQKAVGIKDDEGMIAWIPKKAIENLDKIVVEEGDTVELKLASWFTLEWKEDKY